jgi:hypothetical protein
VRGCYVYRERGLSVAISRNQVDVTRIDWTHGESIIDLLFRHIGACQVQHHIQTELDDLLCQLQRFLGGRSTRAPCNRDCQRRWKGRLSKSPDTVEQVYETRFGPWWEELKCVERGRMSCDEIGEARHGR